MLPLIALRSMTGGSAAQCRGDEGIALVSSGANVIMPLATLAEPTRSANSDHQMPRLHRGDEVAIRLVPKRGIQGKDTLSPGLAIGQVILQPFAEESKASMRQTSQLT